MHLIDRSLPYQSSGDSTGRSAAPRGKTRVQGQACQRIDRF